jgi:hypothetical protein
MARPKTTTETPAAEKLVTAYALRSVPGGGWAMRTYLVPEDSTAHEDTATDVLSAAMGRIQRAIASGAK